MSEVPQYNEASDNPLLYAMARFQLLRMGVETEGSEYFSDQEPTLSQLGLLVNAFMQERASMWAWNEAEDNLETSVALEAAEMLELRKYKAMYTEDEYRDKLASEMADVLIYLLTLSGMRDIDLSAALIQKVHLNEARFPADRFSGTADDFIKQYWTRKIENGERRE